MILICKVTFPAILSPICGRLVDENAPTFNDMLLLTKCQWKAQQINSKHSISPSDFSPIQEMFLVPLFNGEATLSLSTVQLNNNPNQLVVSCIFISTWPT